MLTYTACPEYVDSLADLLGISGLRPDSIKIDGVILDGRPENDGLNLSATVRFAVPLEAQTKLIEDRQHCNAWSSVEELRRSVIEEAVNMSGMTTSEIVCRLTLPDAYSPDIYGKVKDILSSPKRRDMND